MADKCSVDVNFVFKSLFVYELLVFLFNKTNKNYVLTTQYLSFFPPSGEVTGVPGGFKNGPFRGFGFHFGIAIAMSWAT